MIPYLLSDVALEKKRSVHSELLFAHCKQTNKKTNKTSTIKLHVSIYTTVTHIARHLVTILSQPKSEKLDLKKVFILDSAHN